MLVEDDFNRVVGIKLERGFISVEGELISCSNKQPPVLFDQFYHEAGGEQSKGDPKRAKIEAKIEVFEN